MTQSTVKCEERAVIDIAKEKTIRVLHVDDEADFLDAARQILEMQGAFQVDTASSVEEAKEKMKDKEYDAIVCDYIMPRKDGMQFLEELRRSGNHIPFIIFTGKSREAVAIEALNLGADQYLSKIGGPQTVYGELAHGIREATSRRRAEKALIESEEKWRAILSSSPDAITVFGLDGNVVELNQAAMTMHNFSERNEIVGKSSFDFVAPRDLQRARETIQKTLEKGSVKNSEFNLLTKEGQEFPVELSASVVPDALGKPLYIVAAIKDITERRKTMETLQESELKFRLAFENAKDGIFWADPETGTIINCNKAAERLLEKERGEILGHHQSALHPQQKAEHYAGMFKRHIEQKGVVDDEAEIVTKSGIIKPVHITASVTKIGEKSLIQGIFHDTSEHWRAERTLRESQQKFEGLFRSNPEAAVYVDPKFRILDVNPRFEQLFGYCQEEVDGKQLLEVIVPEDKLEEAKMLDDQATQGHVHYDTVRKRKDGSLVSVSISAAPISIEGNLIGYVGMYKDVSDLKKVQQQLEESNTHFQTLFDLMADPVAIVDGKGKILAVTDKVEKITGFRKEELVGKNFLRTKIASTKTKAIMMKNLVKRIMGTHIEPYEIQVLTKDGRELSYEINAERIDYKGEPADMVVFRDISQRKALEAKLRVVGTLTRHDVRNKLSVVTMNTFLAKKKLGGNHEALQHLNEIESAVGDAENIFDVAKTYEMLGMEKLVKMDVGRTLEEAVQLFPNLQGVKVVNDCRGLTVQADSLLKQLFYNLVQNSLKHGQKVSQIRAFYKETEKDQLELVYEDNGVGVPKSEKDKIFEEKYANRTGHGLYAIRKICEVYGWNIRETGEHGKGAQFTITMTKGDR